MGQAVVVLKKGEGRTLKAGGMWVYDNEIASVTGSYEDGDMVIVRDFDGFSMGLGFINRHSKIREDFRRLGITVRKSQIFPAADWYSGKLIFFRDWWLISFLTCWLYR